MFHRRSNRALKSLVIVSGLIATAAMLAGQSARAQESASPRPILEELQGQADALRPIMTTDLGRAFVNAVDALPAIDSTRIVYWNRAQGRALSAHEFDALDEPAQEGFDRLEFDGRFYYLTRYGSPLAYARAIDLAGVHGVADLNGARVADFGFGGIGHLRMLAALGADVVGTEVYDLLRELYAAPMDAGAMPGSASNQTAGGSLSLSFGRFPADAASVADVGSGCRLFLSKNTLKRGYIHPEREVDARLLIQLGVDDATFLARTFDAMEPGGLMIVYNIYPRPGGPDEPYLPWASGEFPFDREATEAAGFEVVRWNVDDTEAMREMALRLGWSEQMDLEEVLAMVTIIRRPRTTGAP